MSAVLREERGLRPLATRDLDAVLAIEGRAYTHPWSRGNFVDALGAGYWAQALVQPPLPAELIGYLIAMPGCDEVHLLNLTVHDAHEHRGHARHMLGALLDHCHAQRAGKLWLEVRASNRRARALYQRYGFGEVGVRGNYYPASHGEREDAIVMSLVLRRGLHALE